MCVSFKPADLLLKIYPRDKDIIYSMDFNSENENQPNDLPTCTKSGTYMQLILM